MVWLNCWRKISFEVIFPPSISPVFGEVAHVHLSSDAPSRPHLEGRRAPVQHLFSFRRWKVFSHYDIYCLDPSKQPRALANLWMLASLASQIQILSFGFASARIGIFPIRSLRSLIRKILPIPSQFFVTGVKNWYYQRKIFQSEWNQKFC